MKRLLALFMLLLSLRGDCQKLNDLQALSHAILTDSAGKVRALLQSNAGLLDQELTEAGITPLQQALNQSDNADVLRTIFSFPLNPNQSTAQGTALQSAISGDNALGVQLLISAGADPNLVGRAKLTPLQTAISTAGSGQPNAYNIIDQLLTAGADPDAASGSTYPPLALALGLSGQNDALAARIVSRLLTAGASRNIQVTIAGEQFPFQQFQAQFKAPRTRAALDR